MLDINSMEIKVPARTEPEQMVKAHPAATLLKTPGWECTSCKHRNPITAAFCQKCQE